MRNKTSNFLIGLVIIGSAFSFLYFNTLEDNEKMFLSIHQKLKLTLIPIKKKVNQICFLREKKQRLRAQILDFAIHL